MKFHNLKGKKVAKTHLNPFSDGRGGQAYDPQIVFEDGTVLRFVVQETDIGEYGIEPVIIKPTAASVKGRNFYAKDEP